ncbi:FtsW/RodA/SpoVE family cell cycle protein [Bacteroidota bacterium]
MKMIIRTLIVLVIALILLGALLVLSASGTYSAVKFNNFYYLFQSHLWKVFAALGVIIVFSLIPYEYYKKYSKPLLFGIVIILFLTFVFAPRVKGASRWIDFGLFRFQPSEMAKLLLIMHLAYLIEKKGDIIKNFKRGLVFLLIWIFLVAGLVFVQPNVSTSLIIMLTAFTLLYVGGAKFKHLIGASISGGITAIGAIMLFPHSRERIFSFIQSFKDSGNMNIQVEQAKIALGSGGWLGVGIGHSRQSDLFLPESYGDFIFSILGEEMGLIGAVGVLFIFLLVFAGGCIIAMKADDKFGQLLAFGLSLNIIFGAFINAAVVMGLIPTTGITLPFISFGGTSIVLFACSIGIILNIGFQYQKRREINLPQL